MSKTVIYCLFLTPYLISADSITVFFVDQLGNKVISGGRHFSTEVVLSKNEVEMRFSNLNDFEIVFSEQK